MGKRVGVVVGKFVRLVNIIVTGFVGGMEKPDNYRHFVLGISWTESWMP